MDRQRFLIPALALIALWRLALLPTLQLSADEALGFLFSTRPDLCHLEMGPLTPWLIRLSTAIFGQTEFGVRLWAPVLAFLASVMLWRVGRGVASATVASWAVVVLQVIPAFNLAATTMTSSIVGMTATMGCILALRLALQNPHPRNSGWYWTAACLLLAILADWRNLLAYGCIVAVLGVPLRRRHHLGEFGFRLISAAAALGIGSFLFWNQLNHWPVWEMGEAEPLWAVLPNVLRWIILISPGLFTLVVWALAQSTRAGKRLPEHGPLIAFALPYAALDFGWGPMERLPCMGWPIWIALSCLILADHAVGIVTTHLGKKITLRTGAFLLAAAFSIALMRSDLIRSVGLPWIAGNETNAKSIWLRWLRSDPSGRMMGWKLGAEALDGLLKAHSHAHRPWFVIAQDWQLAALTEFYLPPETHVLRPTASYPRIHVIQGVDRSSPHALWPRYDSVVTGQEPFAGRDAFYLTEATAQKAPPEIRRIFSRVELLTVVRIMHGGHELRTLKIFACHEYRPPEF